MKTLKVKYIAIILAWVGMGVSGCNKYLDILPDNRTELDSEMKVKKILSAAYPTFSYLAPFEFSSDNVDDYGLANPYGGRFLEQIFRWERITETDNDSPTSFWQGCYQAIANANLALETIEEMGNPVSLNPQRGEALAARAYAHFQLVNMFSQHYSKRYAATDLGIPYVTKTETQLVVQYERNSVQEVYEFIRRDIEEALPLIDDTSYGTTPSFHMNVAAANAFAARVALYMEEWEDAVRYANRAIGINPQSILRDNIGIAANAVSSVNALAVFYNSSNEKANLLIQTANSNQGIYFGPYYTASRFSHGSLIASEETFFANGPFGRMRNSDYRPRVFVYTGTNLDKTLVSRVSFMFEYTDPVAGIGYRWAVYAPFTTEETMLVRAEALIHLKRYEEAIVDMKRWVDNSLTLPPTTFTVESVNQWATRTPYYTAVKSTPKKHLNPEFMIEEGVQENMLHALLYIRRLETMHLGLRWLDIKRYGIEIERRVIASGQVDEVESATKLEKRDKRMALQIPIEVITAGLTPNPR